MIIFEIFFDDWESSILHLLFHPIPSHSIPFHPITFYSILRNSFQCHFLIYEGKKIYYFIVRNCGLSNLLGSNCTSRHNQHVSEKHKNMWQGQDPVTPSFASVGMINNASAYPYVITRFPFWLIEDPTFQSPSAVLGSATMRPVLASGLWAMVCHSWHKALC